jgi:carnitine O-acetyltransferase
MTTSHMYMKLKLIDGFDQPPSHLPSSPAARAAGIARATMIFRKQLKQGLIKPESTKSGPLCMDTYR